MQSYSFKEIVVVDEGSTDNSKAVAERYKDVIYTYQPNQGLSAARNTGLAHSTRDYLVFLDANDWLLPNALQINLRYLGNDPRLAFISGGYKLIYVPENKIWDVTREVLTDHYRHLLQGNYIGMHAAVMFPRWIFNNMQYDTTLSACEDYDLYLQIAKDHPVAHHSELISVYRVHTENMSGNYILMLQTAMAVLNRQSKNRKRS